MLRPFVAYLRVYEPLSAFGEPPDERLARAVEEAALERPDAGEREMVMWLKSQATATPRVLPKELSSLPDVLVLDPEKVPTSASSEVGPGPLVCPLEIRPRSAAALVGFLGEAHPALRGAVVDAIGAPEDRIKSRANSALRDLYGTSMHVLSTTWTVPLPWFSLVDPRQFRLELGSGQHDPKRELSWRTPMTDALRRVAEAEELVGNALGEDAGPVQILGETHRWLTNFHPASAVELDYGGLVQLIDDPTLESDTSADEVHMLLEALRNGDVDEVGEIFQTLRDYWGELAARERFN
ncbi:hypothetical protein [Prauserella rugosa]|uniref:DUF8083 domain-containing protein n=1 Tax=Prauserella rugosa TaxID=43354 RepID=A0A660CHU5_9PSEU|nr:hypothetical protein [Prauserella rugosa]KMS90611.1 hypothetical protein ACZ91_13890 [Streptomyces regensis]TWH21427.1 hypothetical protein JD82_03291 [Prauserella rugosa]